MAADGPHDGLYYQRQHILRNSITPADSAWQFLQQAWYWRRTVSKAWLRTLPWAALAVMYLGLFAATSILSSWISDTATEYRLLVPESCGFFVPNSQESMQDLRSFENQQAATYTRQCYDDDDDKSALCNSLPVPSLPWTNRSTECPFQPSICRNVSAFQMTTGLLDSHHHLGINEPPKNRIGYRRETVCSPLETLPTFAEFIQGDEAEEIGWADNVTIKYLYGPRGSLSNYTHLYNTNSFFASMAYSVWAYANYAGRIENVWTPTDALKTERSDTVILLIIPNSIVHLERNDDPVFSANFEFPAQDTMGYLPDKQVSPIACIDRYQFCNPNNDICTPLQESNALVNNLNSQDLGLNSEQRAIAMRLAFLSGAMSFYDLMFTRAQSFLRAQDRVANLIQHRLPSDQWHSEMSALFQDALSLLQHQITNYPTGPSRPGNISVVTPWTEDSAGPFPSREVGPGVQSAMEDMCHKQRVKMTDGTLNFSILGLGILLGIGCALIAQSFILEPVVSFFQRKANIGAQKARRWERDDSLQVMRMLYETNGAGDWMGTTATFPRTKTAEPFKYDALPGYEQHSMPQEAQEGSEEGYDQMVEAEHEVRRKPVPSASATHV